MLRSNEGEPTIENITIQIIYDQHIACRYDYLKTLSIPCVRFNFIVDMIWGCEYCSFGFNININWRYCCEGYP
jgi:hypothetical protein